MNGLKLIRDYACGYSIAYIYHIRILIGVSILSISACWTDDVIRAHDATVRVNTVIQAKVIQCIDAGETQPPQAFVVPHDVQEDPLILCEATILTNPCPMTYVPAACWALLLQPAAKDVDAIF